YWELGIRLNALHRNSLYKTRVGADGKPVHSTWNAFCEAELNLTGNHARDVMGAVARFSEEHVTTIGIEKLKFIARAPEKEQPKLLAMAPEMTKRAIEKKVRDFAKPALQTAKDRIARQADDDARKRRAEVADGSVTVVFQMGETRLPLTK